MGNLTNNPRVVLGQRLAVVMGVACLGLAGCGVPNYVTASKGSTLFLIADINGGAVLRSNINAGVEVNADTVNVVIANRPKNPQQSLVPQIPQAILINRYMVRYFRTDGRNVEGVDVPYSISGGLATAVDVDLTDKNVTIPIEVVRAQAKLEPPLRNLRGLVTSPTSANVGGTALVITVIAEITIYGHQISGEDVSATGQVQIDFGDFGAQGLPTPGQ